MRSGSIGHRRRTLAKDASGKPGESLAVLRNVRTKVLPESGNQLGEDLNKQIDEEQLSAGGARQGS